MKRARSKTPSPISSTKEGSGKKLHYGSHTIQALLEKNEQTRSSRLGSPVKPMVVLPPLKELDVDVFGTLPQELQREMADYYLRNEKEMDDERMILFNKILNQEGSRTEVTTEEKELLGFLERIKSSMYSIEDIKIIMSYMREYDVNSELEIVLEVCVMNALLYRILLRKNLVRIFQVLKKRFRFYRMDYRVVIPTLGKEL